MQPQPRGIIILEGGKWEMVPEFGLDRELITWPLAMPEIRAGELPKAVSAEDFYRRYKVEGEDLFVFLKIRTPFSR